MNHFTGLELKTVFLFASAAFFAFIICTIFSFLNGKDSDKVTYYKLGIIVFGAIVLLVGFERFL